MNNDYPLIMTCALLNTSQNDSIKKTNSKGQNAAHDRGWQIIHFIFMNDPALSPFAMQEVELAERTNVKAESKDRPAILPLASTPPPASPASVVWPPPSGWKISHSGTLFDDLFMFTADNAMFECSIGQPIALSRVVRTAYS
jgi:hypothetical protein